MNVIETTTKVLICGLGIYRIQNKNPQFGKKLPKGYRSPTH
jgi:hypothetical protein